MGETSATPTRQKSLSVLKSTPPMSSSGSKCSRGTSPIVAVTGTNMLSVSENLPPHRISSSSQTPRATGMTFNVTDNARKESSSIPPSSASSSISTSNDKVEPPSTEKNLIEEYATEKCF